jgi:Recombination endonuclease VII
MGRGEAMCATCFRAGAGDIIDHDHRTGLVRGFLCRRCNRLARSSVPHRGLTGHGHLRRFEVYGQYPPTAAARVSLPYASGGVDDEADLWRWLWWAGPGGTVRWHDDTGRLFKDTPTTAVGLRPPAGWGRSRGPTR